MQHVRQVLLGFLLIGGWLPQMALSKTLTLVHSSGESAEFELEEMDRFLDLLTQIQLYFQEEKLAANQDLEGSNLLTEDLFSQISQFDFTLSHAGVTIRAKKEHWRDYSVSVKSSEKEDVAYIVKTLANESLFSIGKSKSSLTKAGDRINHLHPFRFFITVFTDEELKAGVHAIRDRGGWIWSGFTEGITKSLNEEAGRHNLLQFTADFASRIKIDAALILPSIEQGKWNDFINILIDKIPREIDPNRYNM